MNGNLIRYEKIPDSNRVALFPKFLYSCLFIFIALNMYHWIFPPLKSCLFEEKDKEEKRGGKHGGREEREKEKDTERKKKERVSQISSTNKRGKKFT